MQYVELASLFPNSAETCKDLYAILVCSLRKKTQPGLSLEVCCAMFAKYQQQSSHWKLWTSQDISETARQEWKNL